MISKVVFLVFAASIALGFPENTHNEGYSLQEPESQEEGYTYDEPPKAHDGYKAPKGYSFGYDVNDAYSGNQYGHSEASENGVVTGKYHVLLPDGRLQTVTYTADHEHGYVAQVTYSKPQDYQESNDVYEAPNALYVSPEESYETPDDSYQAPEESYEAPEVKYSAPKETYESPKTSYDAPVATYKAPEALSKAYSPPEVKYRAPVFSSPTANYRAPTH